MRHTLTIFLMLVLGGCATKSQMTVKTDPPGGRVSFDEQYVGDAPVTFDVWTGKYSGLTVSPPSDTDAQGRPLYEQYVYLGQARPTAVFVDLRKKPKKIDPAAAAALLGAMNDMQRNSAAFSNSFTQSMQSGQAQLDATRQRQQNEIERQQQLRRDYEQMRQWDRERDPNWTGKPVPRP